MKLCKDCKHASGDIWEGYGKAMCGHPDAKRSVVDGSLQTLCVEARGDQIGGARNHSVCWPDAKLFEQAPLPDPKPEMKPYQVINTWTPEKRSIWRRIFG